MLLALAAHLAARLAVLVALVAWAAAEGASLAGLVTVYDGAYYRTIAEDGYPRALDDPGADYRTIAFFPLLPLAARPLMALGLPFWTSALLVNVAAGAAAAVLIALVVREWRGDRVAVLAAAAWSVWPLAGVLSLAYPEALFTVLAAGSLLALLRERWLAAGTLAGLAGLARSAGLVLVVACLVAALAAARRDRSVRPLVAPLVAPAGVLGYWAWIGWHTGQPDAWFAVERRGWSAQFDFGIDTLTRTLGFLSTPFSRPEATGVAVFLLLAAALFVAALALRPPLPLVAYLVAGTGLAVGVQNVYSSTPRFLLPLFPLVVPVAVLLAKAPRAVAAGVLGLGGAAAALGAVLVVGFSPYPP